MKNVSESTINNSTLSDNLPSVEQYGKFSGLMTAMDHVRDEHEKYGSKQSKVQATKLRKALMELSKECKTSRTCVLEEVKKIKPIPRQKKTHKQLDEQLIREDVENNLEENVAKKGKRKK